MNPDRFSCSDVLNLNFHNDYFGGAVSHRMYHLLTKDQRERFIKEISRVLKPNGFFALTSRSTKDPSLLESVTISENGARELSFRKGHIINAVNEVELRTILEEHLKIIDLYEYEEQERIGSNRETSLLYALCKNKG